MGTVGFSLGCVARVFRMASSPPYIVGGLLACVALLGAASSEAAARRTGATAPGGRRPMDIVHKDIYVREEPGRIVFGNSRVRLVFDSATGNWLQFGTESPAVQLIAPPVPSPALDFRIDGTWMVAKNGASLASYRVSTDTHYSSVSVRLLYSVSASPGGDTYNLAATYTLSSGQASLKRRASLIRHTSDDRIVHMEGFRFLLPGVAAGEPEQCRVDVPGPWFPATYVAPATPYSALVGRTINFHSAPDGGFGLLAVTNPTLRLTLATWMETGGEVNYGPALSGDGKRITFGMDDHRYCRLSPGDGVESDPQCVAVVHGPPEDVLLLYRAMAVRTMPLDRNTPAWVRDMVLLELYPPYFPGGFRDIAAKLPFYRRVGFNAIYLMPHWVGGYSPIDLYQVDPAFGTPDDLRALVKTAHRLGMRVLFDMVIHGFNEKSPVVRERPDLFVHNEDGSIARHPTWGSMSTDWASPAYQQYMVDLVLHDLREYDNDGYRVDAASYKGPNWDPHIPYPAYRSGSAAPELMAAMIRALRRQKPDAVLLSEVFGPVFYTASNLVHDNQTEAVQQFVELMDAGKVTAADYKAHMASVFGMLPRGANRVFFARNHDTSWFYHFNGYTPRLMAMDAIHALCTIPEVFAGDPKHGPNPDDDPKTFEYYAKLFAVRKRLPELAHGELLLREAETDNPHVFTALRRLNGRVTVVAVSLSDTVEDVRLRVTVPSAPPGGWPRLGSQVVLSDVIGGGDVKADVVAATPLCIRLSMQPFQVVAGRL